MNADKILLVGPGKIGIEYGKILKALGLDMTVVGRGKNSAKKFEDKLDIPVNIGGVAKWIKTSERTFDKAIVAVTGSQLGVVSKKLLENGIKKLLIEKPGGINFDEIKEVAFKAKQKKAEVLVAYNRRFYSSVIKAKKIIKKDGGIKSFSFEFTEWAHQIRKINKPKEVKENWFLHNSTHLIDLAFFLCGEPNKICSFKGGEIDWHPDGCIFTGAGITKGNILFSYHSNWKSPGRWSLDILTNNKRLIFKPLEQLKVQEIGSLKINNIEIKNNFDEKYKPGFYLQTKNFLQENWNNFMKIEDQVERIKIYKKILKGTFWDI